MKVLLVHNFYQQAGGEDEVFAAEGALLERNGHSVVRYEAHNDAVDGMNRIALARKTIWNDESYRKFRDLIERERPDVMHVHNFFPLVSPSIYHAARDGGVPVVQSLHNPRLICPSANFYRDGRLCTDCLGKSFALPGVLHGCYHGSRTHTLGVASMSAFHRIRGTWARAIDAYVVFTEFYRRIFASAGFPQDKLVVKPHFLHPDPGPSERRPEYALYIGRLDPEKGVRTMVNAWRELKGRGIELPLKIRGSGQLMDELRSVVESEGLPVEFIGRLPSDELRELVKGAHFLVWPSEGYYETFGLVAMEAFACGVPVIASETGVATSIVEGGRTGVFFEPGDPADLADKVSWALSNPGEMERLGREARSEYCLKYTADANYGQLIGLYERLLEGRRN